MLQEKPVKICSWCGEDFSPLRYHQTQYCSPACRLEAHQTSTREYRRLQRHQNEIITPCQVCGFKETTDIHHEGDKLYILCPNHHALLSRGKAGIKDFNIIPIPPEKAPKPLISLSQKELKELSETNDWIKPYIKEEPPMKYKKVKVNKEKCKHGFKVCLICTKENEQTNNQNTLSS